ncbi:MAG: pilus assembly protein [Bacillota bacterium]
MTKPRTTLVRLIPAVLLWPWAMSHADVTDIANAPMASSSSSEVKPNILFILDDSGSMADNFLPDAAENFSWNEYGSRSKHCNGLYYNPTVTYSPPVDATGASYPNSSFTAAWDNGFRTADGRTDLTGSVYYKYSGTQADLAFSYNSDGTVKTSSTFYKECNSDVGDSPGKNVFSRVTVGAASGTGGTDERTNFANWYSYYRTRILSMKSAAGRAFKSIGNAYRVGLTTINYAGSDNSDGRYLSIGDFNAAQKSSWYDKFYGVEPGANTPLRAALSKAGRIYAGKIGADPVQYSCQQNFAILSTDGYWNSSAGYQIDGSTAVGNQDGGSTARPMYDALGRSDTLADVAMYYYKTDLRTADLGNCRGALGTDVCENNVPGAGADLNPQQHMTTFTLGLGVNGTLAYSEDYLQGGSADYNAIVQGTASWPAPAANGQTAVDDLWHAAVNGRGTYFSAQNPDSLVSGISKALSSVSARTGTAAAAATSNLEPVAGDNYVYVALYRTVKWDGDLQAKTIDPNSGAISAAAAWSAQPLLDAKAGATTDTRTIYTFNGATGGLKTFTWSNLTAAEKAYFSDMCSSTDKLSQCATLTDAQKTAASGENLVNFIRGQNGYEDESGNANRLYRDREHVLGDMVSSQPVYVKKPPFAYNDDNYATFRDTTQKNRRAMVYVAVNDGMLHAFNGDTGVEEWAYIPPMVLPNLYKLADKSYPANHQYFVDGSPTVGDICPDAPASTCSGSQWKSILVGGLNAGGRGYYALDVTDPANPRALWNFTVSNDADLGYSFGNPVITKRRDGTWVVIVTSGYNNVSPGDGQGYLYVLNANTGAVLDKICTGAGSPATPSGLAKINAWVNSTTSNTAERLYGGDLLGNVWRFDINDTVPPSGKEATLIAELGQINGAGLQPVTVKPELTAITAGGAAYAVINVATGRYLGLTDLGDTSQQSVYAFKDNLTATGLGRVRANGVLVRQTLTSFTGDAGEQLRTSSVNDVDWATDAGWYVDFNPNNESPGERVNVDMQQQLGLLTVATNVPSANACTTGGYAWLYSFDYKTGQYVKTAAHNTVGRKLSTNALIAGIKTIRLTTGKTVTISTDTGGGLGGNDDPTSNPGTGGDVKRASWRELSD